MCWTDNEVNLPNTATVQPHFGVCGFVFCWKLPIRKISMFALLLAGFVIKSNQDYKIAVFSDGYSIIAMKMECRRIPVNIVGRRNTNLIKSSRWNRAYVIAKCVAYINRNRLLRMAKFFGYR